MPVNIAELFVYDERCGVYSKKVVIFARIQKGT